MGDADTEAAKIHVTNLFAKCLVKCAESLQESTWLCDDAHPNCDHNGGNMLVSGMLVNIAL